MLSSEELSRGGDPIFPTCSRLNADLAKLRQAHRREPECPVPVGVAHEAWLTKQEMAEYLGFSPRWVEMRVREGMPCERFGSRLRFQRTPVEKWLKASAVA